MIETVRLREPLRGVAVRVLGVDLLAEAQIRDYHVTENRVEIRDPLRLLASPNAVIIPELLAERLGVREHDTFTVRTPLREETFVVKGLLARGGLADAYGGYIAIMDVWNLQHLLDARGWVDKIEVTLEEGVDREQLVHAIEPALSGRAYVRPTASRPDWIASIISTIDYAAWAINSMSAFVAGLLALAAVWHVADSRYRDLASMQCAGMATDGVVALVLFDSLLISGLGAMIGLGLGIVLAPIVLGNFSRFSTLYSSVLVEHAQAAHSTLISVVVIWLLIGVVGALLPTARLLRFQPLDALAARLALASSPSRSRGRAIIGCLALCIVAAGSLYSSMAPAPLRLVALLVGALAITWTTGGALALTLVRLVRSTSAPWISSPILGITVVRRCSAAGVAVTSIAAVVATLVCFFSVIDSLVDELGAWSAARGKGAIFIAPDPEAPSAITQEQLLSEATISAIRATKGVEDVAPTFNSSISYRGREVLLGSIATEVLVRRNVLESWDVPAAELARSLRDGGIAISHGFSNFFDVHRGDEVVLPTSKGLHPFLVAGIYRDYSGRTGSLHLDGQTYDRYFFREGAHFLRVWGSVPDELLLESIAVRAATLQPLVIRDQAKMQGAARRSLENFRNLLRALAGLCALFGLISILGLTLSGIAVLKRDLSLAQIGGATPADVVRGVAADSVLIGFFACLIGSVLGFAAGSLLCDVLEDLVGWIVPYRPSLEVVVEPITLIVVSLVAGCLAAASRTRSVDVAGSMPNI
jgi:putative ABC transport system permease protein